MMQRKPQALRPQAAEPSPQLESPLKPDQPSARRVKREGRAEASKPCKRTHFEPKQDVKEEEFSPHEDGFEDGHRWPSEGKVEEEWEDHQWTEVKQDDLQGEYEADEGDDGQGASEGDRKGRKPAPDLDREAGLDLKEHHPKDSMRRFFSRHARRPADQKDYFYRTTKTEEGFVTELVTPAFGNRIFQGLPCATEKDAQTSAARLFCNDPRATVEAALLPPQKYKCRKRAGGGGKQWAARQGLTLRQYQGKRADRILDHFRASGCRARADDKS
ncbi:unnamed protein product [Symbiodinium sp. CCMP2592]|nr:unnamed protein product [Symbiodinium sp. CCMP2592]